MLGRSMVASKLWNHESDLKNPGTAIPIEAISILASFFFDSDLRQLRAR